MTITSSVYILFLLNLSRWVEPEVFTAISDLESLLETRQKIIEDVNEYILLEEKRLELLKKRLTLHRKEHENAMRDISDYLGNPISAFILIKSLTSDMDFMQKTIEIAKDNSKCITTNHEDLKYPTWEDLAGAAQAISRLQNVYKIDTHELSEGRLMGVVFSNPMTAEDCFELGWALHSTGDYKTAVSWLTEAQKKYRNGSALYQFREIDIAEYITATHIKLGELKTALNVAKQVLKLDPKNARAANLTIHCSQLIAEEKTKEIINQLVGKTEEISTEEPMSDEELIFLRDKQDCEPLCRGETNMSRVIDKSLICQYLTKNHPFLRIAPFKIEYMSLQPEILVFHGVMSDAEIKFIQDTAKLTLKRSEVRVNPGQSAASRSRIGKLTWLRDEESAVIARVSQRVADMTGLSMATAEDLQVVNYGIGGHNEVHKDYLRPEKFTELIGNRIATVLFYLSDVALGGATVFPRLGVRLVPRRGTAAVWRNLHPSGEGDLTTRHAACPVLHGSKWVATKWIHEVGQELLKPCTLNQGPR